MASQFIYVCRYVCTPNNTVRNIISNKPVSGERAHRTIAIMYDQPVMD